MNALLISTRDSLASLDPDKFRVIRDQNLDQKGADAYSSLAQFHQDHTSSDNFHTVSCKGPGPKAIPDFIKDLTPQFNSFVEAEFL